MPGDTEQKWHEACGFHHVGSLTSWQAVGPHFSASPLSKPASGTSSAVCCARDSTLTAARQLCNHWNQTEPRAAPWPPFLLHRKRRAPEEPARHRMTKLSIHIYTYPQPSIATHGYPWLSLSTATASPHIFGAPKYGACVACLIPLIASCHSGKIKKFG